MINNENSMQFLQNFAKRCIMITLSLNCESQQTKIVTFWIASEVLKGCQNIFGHIFWATFESAFEVTGTFTEIPVMIRWNFHAIDSEKVGRYKMAARGILKVKVADIHFNNLGDSNFFYSHLEQKKDCNLELFNWFIRKGIKKLSHKLLWQWRFPLKMWGRKLSL